MFYAICFCFCKLCPFGKNKQIHGRIIITELNHFPGSNNHNIANERSPKLDILLLKKILRNWINYTKDRDLVKEVKSFQLYFWIFEYIRNVFMQYLHKACKNPNPNNKYFGIAVNLETIHLYHPQHIEK